jgi:type I restriction enzyme R subunit
MVQPFNDDSEYLSELVTRKRIIDPQLEQVNWKKAYIKEEVNSTKSDFKKAKYKFVKDGIEKGKDRFIDYLLLDENYKPLAIIEAKRFSKDYNAGFSQAMVYREDIKKQIGKDLPVFLTNGAEWKFIDENGIERPVSGVFSQEDLSRRQELSDKEVPTSSIHVNSGIVDRPRNLQIVKQTLSYLEEGHRNALIQMATGTGKTRVAMAITDALRKANKIENVLFVADRTALANQASGTKGFKRFFPEEAINDLRLTKKDYTGRLFVTTIQTLMSKVGKKFFFQTFSPAYFDLIIFDESHRSFYDKGNLVLKYFDTIKIGLTATPRSEKEKDTYKLFECIKEKPTAEYSYDEAITDGVLVPYDAEIISTKVLSLGIKGVELSNQLKTELRKQEEDPDKYVALGTQFERIFTDEKTNELIVSEFMQRCRRSDEGLPAKTIFFCASQKHAQAVKDTFAKLFPKLSPTVRVITSNMDYAQTEVNNFTTKNNPRIALSVGMLDTGVDVPEVCNLVFVKPVFSHIRFWQMLGRGTRNEAACEHKEWLPMHRKDSFLILDFMFGGHSNIKYHKMERAQRNSSKSVQTIIFENRVALLKKDLTKEQKEVITKKILSELKELDEESFLVRQKSRTLAKIHKNKFELEKYVTELNQEIAPLMILAESEGPEIASFILQVERLFGHILNNNLEKIDSVKDYVEEHALNVLEKDNLQIIKDNKNKLTKILQESFWNSLSFEDVEYLVHEIAPLMKYFTPYKKKFVRVNADDLVLAEETEKYNTKDSKLAELLENNPLAQKIRDGTGITSEELIELEGQLKALNPALTIESIQEYQKKDFIEFLLDVMGISHKEKPREQIEKRFEEQIIKNYNYNAKQIEFLILLKKVFANKKHLELTDLTRMPLAEKRPLDNFSVDELKIIVKQANKMKLT